MTHILQKLRDDVAGMPFAKGQTYTGIVERFEVLALIDAAIAAQPEPDELVARLRSFAAWYVSCAGGNVPPEAADADAAADLITSQQAEIRALTAELETMRRCAGYPARKDTA